MADCNIQKTVQRAKGKIPFYYELSFNEMCQIADICKDRGLLEAVMVAFDFGFIRGTRAKARDRVSTL